MVGLNNVHINICWIELAEGKATFSGVDILIEHEQTYASCVILTHVAWQGSKCKKHVNVVAASACAIAAK